MSLIGIDFEIIVSDWRTCFQFENDKIEFFILKLNFMKRIF